MPKNKITDLNNHLFAQMERLNDDDLSQKDLDFEIRRAKAMSGVATAIVSSAKVTIAAMVIQEKNGEKTDAIGKMLLGEL